MSLVHRSLDGSCVYRITARDGFQEPRIVNLFDFAERMRKELLCTECAWLAIDSSNSENCSVHGTTQYVDVCQS